MIRARLALVEHDISRLPSHDRMKFLEEERDSLLSHLANNTAIVSPLRRMPPELLGEIFQWTLPPIDEEIMSASCNQWVLTKVSSHWRAIAHSTPSLWSTIVVDFPSYTPHALSIIKVHIQRAQTLKIHFEGSSDSDSQPQIEIFQCLAEHCSRWQELSIELTSDLVPLLSVLRDRIPLLRRLSMSWNDSESQTGVDSIDCFERAPSLVDAAIFNKSRHVPILLPAHQLTRYWIDGPWAFHRGLLTVAPNLVQVHICVRFSAEPLPESDDTIHLLRLQRLFVSNPEVLNYLRAPVLEEIALQVDDELEEEDPIFSPFDLFILRSGCTLRRLSFDGPPTTLLLAEILRKYPSITELATIYDLKTVRRTRDLIFHLAITDAPAMSPQLSDISFGYYDDNCIEYTPFLLIVQSR
ncbi:hypothetical protein C8R44DRAFT_976021 [Mycena epipterygia]|nr:hypothetical protein C8R44DRAFT_976021 [Mycena epipterygia]